MMQTIKTNGFLKGKDGLNKLVFFNIQVSDRIARGLGKLSDDQVVTVNVDRVTGL